jgi:DnaJ-class molecular chaperone
LDDPYKVLGVSRDATADQIKTAYRKLARSLHPDLHPNDKQAEDKFKKVGSAYDLLGDPKKKARFDAGEIDANGSEQRGRGRARSGASAGGGGGFGGFGGFGFGGESAQDIFDELLRRKDKGRQKGWSPFDDQPGMAAAAGGDAHFTLKITFAEAALGATKRITLTSGKNLDVKVPPAAKDASTLRLKGQGHAGRGGGAAGDALIEIKVEPHPFFQRQENDVVITVPVTLGEAIGGTKITVPTVDGKVAVTIPPGANSGTTLRLKGKGAGPAGARGDQLVTLKVMLPDRADDELADFLKKWESKHPYDVRKKEGMD